MTVILSWNRSILGINRDSVSLRLLCRVTKIEHINVTVKRFETSIDHSNVCGGVRDVLFPASLINRLNETESASIKLCMFSVYPNKPIFRIINDK